MGDDDDDDDEMIDRICEIVDDDYSTRARRIRHLRGQMIWLTTITSRRRTWDEEQPTCHIDSIQGQRATTLNKSRRKSCSQSPQFLLPPASLSTPAQSPHQPSNAS